MHKFKMWPAAAAVAAALVASAGAHAATQTVDVAALLSQGELGTSSNPTFSFFLGASATISSVSYNVTLEANGPSWLSEMGVAVTDSTQTVGMQLFPGFGENVAGVKRSTGLLNSPADGLGFSVGQDGMLRLEFFESASDGLMPDGVWRQGSLSFEFTPAVPEPSTYALMLLGVGGIALMRRRSSINQ